MASTKNNPRPVIPTSIKQGPLAHSYTRAGYVTRWEFTDGMEYSNAVRLGYREVDIRNGDGFNDETAKFELASTNGSTNLVRPAERGSNSRNLILMEMPIELFHQYEVAFDARNQEAIDQLTPDDSVGRLDIKKM